MFNLSGSELVVLLLVALIVLGPERLPEAIRSFGRVYGQLRRMGEGFQSEMRSVLDEPIREVRDTAELARRTMSGDDLPADSSRSRTPTGTSPSGSSPVSPPGSLAGSPTESPTESSPSATDPDSNAAPGGPDPDADLGRKRPIPDEINGDDPDPATTQVADQATNQATDETNIDMTKFDASTSAGANRGDESPSPSNPPRADDPTTRSDGGSTT